jgi:hypothetical protein
VHLVLDLAPFRSAGRTAGLALTGRPQALAPGMGGRSAARQRGGMTSIRLRGPADFLAALPYQLGYHPDDAMVVVALHDRAIGMIERIDLPASVHARAVSRSLVGPLLRERPDGVMLVGYESRADASLPLLRALRSELGERDVPVIHAFVVRGDRWFAPFCDDECCPMEGEQLPAPEDTPAVADFIGLGVAPLPARESLAALVAADPRVCRGVDAALRGTVGVQGLDIADDDHARAVRRLSWLSLWAAVCDVSETGRPIEAFTADEVAQLVASLGDVELRDGVIAWLCPGTLPLETLTPDLVDAIRCSLPVPTWSGGSGDHGAASARGRLTARLQWLVRAIPDLRAAPALTVLANFTWWGGDGAVTRVALDRALEHSPGYRLALLLERMVDLGVRPRPLWRAAESA